MMQKVKDIVVWWPMYCHERAFTRETVEMKIWNKIVIFVFFVQKVFSWFHKIPIDRLMSHDP